MLSFSRESVSDHPLGNFDLRIRHDFQGNRNNRASTQGDVGYKTTAETTNQVFDLTFGLLNAPCAAEPNASFKICTPVHECTMHLGALDDESEHITDAEQ